MAYVKNNISIDKYNLLNERRLINNLLNQDFEHYIPKIFVKKRDAFMKIMVQSQIDASVAGGANVQKKMDQFQQEYINAVVNLFYALK